MPDTLPLEPQDDQSEQGPGISTSPLKPPSKASLRRSATTVRQLITRLVTPETETIEDEQAALAVAGEALEAMELIAKEVIRVATETHIQPPFWMIETSSQNRAAEQMQESLRRIIESLPAKTPEDDKDDEAEKIPTYNLCEYSLLNLRINGEDGETNKETILNVCFDRADGEAVHFTGYGKSVGSSAAFAVNVSAPRLGKLKTLSADLDLQTTLSQSRSTILNITGEGGQVLFTISRLALRGKFKSVQVETCEPKSEEQTLYRFTVCNKEKETEKTSDEIHEMVREALKGRWQV
jgi:hypothetical protein